MHKLYSFLTVIFLIAALALTQLADQSILLMVIAVVVSFIIGAFFFICAIVTYPNKNEITDEEAYDMFFLDEEPEIDNSWYECARKGGYSDED